MSDHKSQSSDNDLLSNPREHDHLGEYSCPTCGKPISTDCVGDNQRETGNDANNSDEKCDNASVDDGNYLENVPDVDKCGQFDTPTSEESEATASKTTYHTVDFDDLVFDEGLELHIVESDQIDRIEKKLDDVLEDRNPSIDFGEDIPDEELEPVYATIHFYYNDPDSMARFRRVIKVEQLYFAIQEFDNWMRGQIKHCDEPPNAFEIREEFHKFLDHRGIDIWEE